MPLTIKVFKESTSKQVPYVAYSPELELSAAGKDAASAKKALLRVVNDVLGHKIKEGSLAAFLDELGFVKSRREKSWQAPELSFVQVPLTLAKV